MRKVKIDVTPKIFEDYNELWERDIFEYYIMPVIKENRIIGYKIEDIEEAEEQYRALAKEMFDKGFDNEKSIRKKLDCPIWVSMNIENRISCEWYE